MKINFRKHILPLLLLAMLPASESVSADSYYDRKVSLFELLPVNSEDIIFLGNSITDGGEFAELLEISNVKNRGIISDTMVGVEKRLAQVMRGKPKKVFLLIGINDVSHNLTVSQLAKRYESLVSKMQAMSPETKIYLQSVMPINNDFKRYKGLIGKEKIVKGFNKEIERISAEKGLVFIDLTPVMSDASGKLKKEYTNDGLHLTGKGYKAWVEKIMPYVKD